MILGIDVGGTHTDAALIDKDFTVKKKAKVPTNQENLIDSLLQVAQSILSNEKPDTLDKIVLSTTMSTNAIIQGKISKVGMVLASGPGLAPSALKINEYTHFISGYVNHRGISVADINDREVTAIRTKIQDEGIDHLGIIAKFSPRNPQIELEIGNTLGSDFKHISLGHRMSGNLNFPRRIATTYLNAALWDNYNKFVDEAIKFAKKIEANVPIYILKADGGTFKISQSAEYPAQTILSGPAASIMGILSLTESREDAIALDVGGTTTDIAIFAEGVPLLEPLGVTIEGHKTLIRGLRTTSIGIGGDSKVKCENGEIIIGPEREGPAVAFGGPFPTPTDAMIVLGLTDIGDREKAVEAITLIAEKKGSPIDDTAKEIFDLTCEKIAASVNMMIDEINNAPVYTVHEILEGKKIIPQRLYVVGGPAHAMAARLGEILQCPPTIPDYSEVANAVGAALAKTTTELTLLADTEKKTITIVEEGIQNQISSKFTQDDALTICKEILRERALKMGAARDDLKIEIIEKQVFNMVRNGYRTGQNIRIKAQIKPGLISGSRKGGAL